MPYYGRAWSTNSGTAPRHEHLGSTKYGRLDDRALRDRRRLPRDSTAAATTPSRASPGPPTSARTARRPTAASRRGASSTRRRRRARAKYDLVNSYGLRGAGIWALGYDGTRTELWAAIADKFVTDTIPPVVSSASITGTAFSPNGDGIVDTISASLSASGATGWTFSAAPLSGATVGTAVRTASGSGGTVTFVWDGRANSGAGVADGMWRLTLTALDASGNRVSRAWDVRLDRVAPVLGSTAPARFSPNGDGAADTAALSWTSTETIRGTARIYQGSTLIRSWTVTDVASGALTWDGKDGAGRGVADGTYTFTIAGADIASNRAARSLPLVVDRTLSLVRWSRAAFYPQDGDGLVATAKATFALSRTSVVSVVIASGTTVVRTVWTNRTLPAGTYGWTWNGRNNSGAFVAPGNYQVWVTTTNGLGTTRLGRTILADAFRVVRSASAVRSGQTLTLTLTTTEPLRSNPNVRFTQPGLSMVQRTATSLGSGKYRVTFTIAPGPAGTATIRIAARDSSYGVNASTATVTIL